MALLWIDGFDHYATADISSVGYSVSGTPIIDAAKGRFGGGGLNINTATAEHITKTIPTTDVLVAGFAFRRTESSPPTVARNILEFREGSTLHLAIRLNLDNTLSVMRGTTALATTTETMISDVFMYLELKGTIHNTTGAYDLHINGVSVLSASGTDTQNGGTATVDTVMLGVSFNPGGAVDWRFDDFYILDDAGAAPNNDFLGDVRVDTIFPNAEGNYSQFTPSTGTDNSALVDEATPNGDTDYNSDSTATNKDSYAMTNLAAMTTQTIYGVQTSMYMKKSDAGARSAKVGVRSSTTDNVSASQALTTDYLYYHNLHELDPATSAAWTESGVNAMETLVETV